MIGWAVLVVALPEEQDGPMLSRLPSFLHPVAGRPLVWHALNVLTALSDPPPRVQILAPPDLIDPGLFEDLSLQVEWLPYVPGSAPHLTLEEATEGILLLDACAVYTTRALATLIAAGPGAWIGQEGSALAAFLTPDGAEMALRENAPFAAGTAVLRDEARLPGDTDVHPVRTRHDLAIAGRRIRDALVRSLMDAGVTFLLPETVIIDVDVRVGRDSIVYGGVALEGQTTVGEETVIGPGCRVINSWIGSGVELKGWNYIANTSVRNRAILEPYVRRGFD